MKRSLGIDLHTNSFTCCYLQADGSETIRTWPLQGGCVLGPWEKVTIDLLTPLLCVCVCVCVWVLLQRFRPAFCGVVLLLWES